MASSEKRIVHRRLSRRLSKPIQSAARKHACQIGEITLAWNLLQDGLFVLFWAIASDQRHGELSKAQAVWHSHRNDKAQRDLLLAVALSDSDLPKKLQMNLKWLVDRTNELASQRNDAIHTPVKFANFQDGLVIPIPQAFSGRKQAVQRMQQLPLAGTWRAIRGDLLVLADFCNAIYSQIVVSGFEGTPWPGKPKLQTVLAKQKPMRKRAKREKRTSTQVPA